MSLQSTFIVSVPRSGSTVLTNLLDHLEDVVCPPESFFPAALEMLDDREMSDRRKIAALFLVSCSDGSPLSLEEAETCIRPDKKRTLDELALAIARKLGREPAGIRSAVWKFTRMAGCWKLPAHIGGKFIILKRNPHNVYESQFRVHFGEKNRNPLRFALFAASYDAAFTDYPQDLTLKLDYPDIPKRLDEIAAWIGSSGKKRGQAAGSLDAVAGCNPWHANINKPFDNCDAEKLRNLTFVQSTGFRAAYALLRRLGFLNHLARRTADRRQMEALRNQAAVLLEKV